MARELRGKFDRLVLHLLVVGHDIGEPDPFGLGAVDALADEQDAARRRKPDPTRQVMQDAGIRDQPDAKERKHEGGAAAHHDEVGTQAQIRRRRRPRRPARPQRAALSNCRAPVTKRRRPSM